MKNKNSSLSDLEIKRLQILNRGRRAKGFPEIEPEDYKQIIKLFSNKNGYLSGVLLRVYESAFKKYGKELFIKKFPCKVCGLKKGFRAFKFIKEEGAFFDTCRDCNPSQNSGFYYVDRRRKKKLLAKPTPRISYSQYRRDKLKYKDAADRFHPRLKSAVQKMLQVFGRKILKKEKPCKTCGNSFPLFRFPANFNSVYIGNRCRRCESIRIADYIQARLDKRRKSKNGK
ncbi:hypothetical protein [Leptospira licerasiae]|uniref:hypothetical protein n=1 Tax=Leptospira licerasiae TaxID=447106 RepID=UPI00108477E7|nr:hypothetical protein [Leptospira licerasiae]TGM87890.1 hypothetical protein EHR05_14635 [Leptospira licerasiae]